MATEKQIEAAYDYHNSGWNSVRKVVEKNEDITQTVWAVGPAFVVRAPDGYIPRKREGVWVEQDGKDYERKTTSLVGMRFVSEGMATIDKSGHPPKKCTGRYVRQNDTPVRELAFPLYALFRGGRVTDCMLEGTVVYGYDKGGTLQAIAQTRPVCSEGKEPA